MFRIAKTMTFSASHTLNLSPPHPCARLHGHNYTVEVILASQELDVHGFVVDYGELIVVKKYIDTTFDHRHLNEILDVEPTAENLAFVIYEYSAARWPQIWGIRVSETPSTWAEYSPSLHSGSELP